MTESPFGSIRITGIKFGTGTARAGRQIRVYPATGGSPVLIYGNWFDVKDLSSVEYRVNRGVVYQNSFNGYLCAESGAGCTPSVEGAVYVQPDSAASWASASTMGMADATGASNLYMEDNYVLGMWGTAAGPEEGGRMVIRHNVFDSSALGWHGADSGPIGARHFEIYDNTFVQSDMDAPHAGDGVTGFPYNINQWALIRGGTGVITDNVMPNLLSWWGDKPELTVAVYILNWNVSRYFACWGAGTAGTQYPAPRQVGYGHVTGRAGVDPLGVYYGDSEPLYIWNNSGTQVMAPSEGPGGCTNPDLTADYVVSGRDYYLNAGPKPGYAKYPYPHPLRMGSRPAPPANVSIKR